MGVVKELVGLVLGGRIAPGALKGVAVAASLNEVAPDGHIELILALGVAHNHLAVPAAGQAVNIEGHAVNRNGRAAVADGAAHLEAGHVDEVGIVDDERSAADECRAARGIKAVDALGGIDAVARAAAGIGDTTDLILALIVGHAVGRQLVGRRDNVARTCVGTHVDVVAVGKAVTARDVKGVRLEALVKGDVGFQAVALATDEAIHIGGNFGGGKHAVPQAHLVHVAGEVGQQHPVVAKAFWLILRCNLHLHIAEARTVVTTPIHAVLGFNVIPKFGCPFRDGKTCRIGLKITVIR